MMKPICAFSLSALMFFGQSSACLHNFDTATPATNVYLTVKSGQKMRTLMSLTGKSSEVAGANPVKLILVKKDSDVTARDLTQKEVDDMSGLVSNVQNHMRRGVSSPKRKRDDKLMALNSLEDANEFSTIKKLTTNSGTVVEIEEVTRSLPNVFTVLMKKYNFASTHEAAMNEKLKTALDNDYKVVVAKAIIAPGKEVHIGVEMTTPLAKDSTASYVEAVVAQKAMNLWITRAASLVDRSSGGVITHISDVPFAQVEKIMAESDALAQERRKFMNSDSSQKIGVVINTHHVQDADGGNKVTFDKIPTRAFKLFEEIYAGGDQIALGDYAASGGSILYAE